MDKAPSNREQDLLRIDQAIAEYLQAHDSRGPFDLAGWLERYADVQAELKEFVENDRLTQGKLEALASEQPDDPADTLAFSHRAKEARSTSASRDASEMPDEIGGYRLVRLLGSGGMGRVFEAVDGAGHRVAIKLLSRQYSRSPESLLRFKQEGAIASAINHPRCVFVRAADEDGGQPYIIMELMSGKTLRDAIASMGRMSVQEAVAKTMDIVDGLTEAHLHGMIHRDIKPANCYLEDNGRVKIGDFGLARSVSDSVDLTLTGSFVGTPLFASPEQIRGEKLDERTDVYSVCGTLYFLLTGKAPFAGLTATQVIAKIVSEDPVSPRQLVSSIPPKLERLVLKGLNRDRAQRFQSMVELRDALAPFVTGKQVVSLLGKRAAAYGIDFLLLTIVGILCGLVWKRPSDIPEIPDIGLYFVVVGPIWLYNLVMEGIWNATLGKFVMKLKVASSKTGERPRLFQIFTRAAIYTIFSGVASDMVLYATLSTSDVAVWTAWQSVGYVCCYAVALAPLVFSGGRLLLHDLLSGTSIIDVSERSGRRDFARKAQAEVRYGPADHWPSRFGTFDVRGLVARTGTGAILLAEDKRLSRQVWLFVRPKSAEPITPARQACDRTSRLRWLTGGTEGEYRWDAFLAPNGSPIAQCCGQGQVQGWRSTRRVLLLLLDELQSSKREGMAVNIESMRQIWLDPRDRPVVLDWPPETEGPGSQPNSAVADPAPIISSTVSNSTSQTETVSAAEPELNERDYAVLRETARFVLTGETLPLNRAAERISTVVPIRARKILDKLDGTLPAYRLSAEMRTDLEQTAEIPDFVTLTSRMATLGLLVLTLGLAVFMMVALGRLGNQFAITRLTDRLIKNEALGVVVADSAALSRLYTEQPDLADDWPTDRLRELCVKYRTELQEAYRQRYASLGSIHRTFVSANGYDEAIAENLSTLRPQISSSGPLRVEVTDWRRMWSALDEDITSAELAKTIASAPSTDLVSMTAGQPAKIIWFVLALPLILMIWGGFARGGIPMLAAGLRVVHRDGKPAGLAIYLLRSLLIWLPVLFLLFWLAWLDIYRPEQTGTIALICQVLALMPVVYAVVALASPRRGPHDWLLRTYLVPR